MWDSPLTTGRDRDISALGARQLGLWLGLGPCSIQLSRPGQNMCIRADILLGVSQCTKFDLIYMYQYCFMIPEPDQTKSFGVCGLVQRQPNCVTSYDTHDVFRRTKETFGRIDLVVNNAGIVHEVQWEKCIDINLNGTIRGTQLGLEYLRKDNGGNGGVILNMASLAGIFPVNYTPVYCASKHAVIGYTRSWALHPDAVNNGVRLFCLCPSFVDTDMIKMDDKSKYIGPDLAQSVLDKYGVMSIDKITQEFLKAIEDETNNGESITITMKGVNNIPSPRP
uniref:15-hydroxyprostaglandin dehydrogenase [NAD(+)] n=1 Tax=Crassostrea virginica TaxID=6565 RepID=A0A8B8DW40_CRAVI|nr:15-hydroxyprostaglandin dehydrogenase [NAD(+)]-like [Crassostrea virginica]